MNSQIGGIYHVFFDTAQASQYYCAPMSDRTPKNVLPRIVDPRRFCQQGVVLRGYVPHGDLPRLVENKVVVDRVDAELVFAVDEQRARVVTGNLAVDVQIECQRCLEPMPLTLDCNVSLAVVWDEESSREIAGAYDPWIVASEETDLYAMIEEEILLNLPYVSYHDYSCGQLAVEDDSEDEVEPEKQNPFQALQQLKDKMKQ
jgi:uncharacterized protein